MMADPTVTYAGWAFKEGSLVKNWKKRFLVVKRRELAYYKTTDHTSRHAQLLGAMRVARVEKAANITNGLIISSMEGRQLKIFMDTAAERDRCYAALIEWCHPAGSTNEPPPNVRVHGVASTAQPSTVAATAAAARGRMAGWLEKQGQNMPTWKRRYFVLDEGILTYSQHEGGSSLARHRVLGVRRDRTKPFTLALTLDTGRELRVSASSEHDLNDWSRALHATIQTSPSRPPSGHGGYEERSSGIDQRGQLDDSQASYNNLFGAPPAAVEDANEDDDAGRRSTNMSFGHNIRLDFDGENTSFIECAPPQPAAKPWSPKAPGVDTIRRMRIEQNLLVDSDDDDDEFVITRVVSSTQASSSASGSSSPVPSRRPNAPDYKKKKKQETVGPGPCCCVVM